MRTRISGLWLIFLISFIMTSLIPQSAGFAATPPSTLSAFSIGPGADVVGQTNYSPNGQPDYHILLGGLRTAPSQITVTSDSGAVWHAPYDGVHSVIGFYNVNGTNGDMYFDYYPSNTLNIQVGYADGSFDQTVVLNLAQQDTIRFLERSTFGPTSSLIARVEQIGLQAFLNEQLAAPMSDYPDLPFWPQTRPTTCVDTCQRDNYTFYQIQKHFFSNALYGQDQLRQRMAFALSQILVTSQVDVPMPAWMRSYQQLLYRNAFGNFRQLLYDVTLHPTMGRFLDMLNNRCQTPTPANVNLCRNGLTSQPNENYAREILQLFSIGTFQLYQDGTRKLDSNGNPIPTYDQKTVEEFARIFTGWVLSPALSAPAESGAATVPNYRDPMVVHKDSLGREDYHDRDAKVLLNGTTIPAGRTTEQDLNDAIDNIAFHPNVAPFISKQLIQQVVTSNPSRHYVRRIATVFIKTRNSPTQLFEVISAILLDHEGGSASILNQNNGKLREPVLFMTNILRSFAGTSDGVLNSLNVGGSLIGTADMSEDLFNPASVFNYFPPTTRVPAENAVGPEFAIFSSLTALRRANFVNRVIFSNIPPALPNRPLGTAIDLSPWDPLAANPEQLVDELNRLLMHGLMSAEMRQAILTAVNSIPASNVRLRVRTAIYLVLTSTQYQVQR